MPPRPTPLTLIALYEALMAVMFLAIGCVVLPITLVILPFGADTFVGFIWRIVVIGALLTLAFAFGVASAVVAVGLVALREWARIAAIVLAILVLPAFPIWTVIGILVIVYLVSDEGKTIFAASTRSARVQPPWRVGPVPPPAPPSEPPSEAPTVVMPRVEPNDPPYPPAPGSKQSAAGNEPEPPARL